MKAPYNVKLIRAKYLTDYKYQFVFSNGKESIIDFKHIVYFHYDKKYLDVTKFKKMKVHNEYGDIYWGKNWDICFHIDQYYGEKVIEPLSKKERNKVVKQYVA